MCLNSPSLECDSGEEDVLGHSYPCSSLKQQSILRPISGEERDSFDTSPDFNRTHSDSTHTAAKVHLSPLCLWRIWGHFDAFNGLLTKE